MKLTKTSFHPTIWGMFFFNNQISKSQACVHDVAVGNRDICVADIWLTPERNQLANFLPTVKSDTFRLVVPRKIEEITFYHRISRPFMPFSRAAWFGIGGFLFVIAAVMWIEKRCEDGSCFSDSDSH